ncbi:hypothetical protein LXL04_038748 [Taraxacum kok-saghyz]
MSSNNNNQNLRKTPGSSRQQGYRPVIDPAMWRSNFPMSPMSNYPLSPIQQQQQLFQTFQAFPQSQAQTDFNSYQSQQQFHSQQQLQSQQQFQTQPETQQPNVIRDDEAEEENEPRNGQASIKKWTHEEEIVLRAAWCNLSEDQVIGKNQQKD